MLVKLHHGVVGFPDRLMLAPGSPARLIEFKRLRRGRVSKIQDYWHRELASMGHPVAVVRTMAEFKALLTT